MCRLVKFFLVFVIVNNAFGQTHEAVVVDNGNSEIVFMLIEKVVGQEYFQALTHTSHGPGYHTNWVDSGRASEQRTDFIKSIEYLIEVLEHHQDWFYDGEGRRILDVKSKAVDIHLQQELGLVRMAYQVLPDEWLLSVATGKVSKNGQVKSNFQKTTFFRLFNKGASPASFYDLLPELQKLRKLYKSGHPLSDIFVHEGRRTQVLVKAKLDAQILLIKTLAEVAETTDLTLEQFTKLIRDLGRGEGAFKPMIDQMRLKLDYGAINGVNYFNLFRDQQRRVCNAIILEFDLKMHPFMMETPNRCMGKDPPPNYLRAERELHSNFDQDPVMTKIRQQLTQVVGKMTR